MTKRMRKEDWTKEHDEILRRLSKTVWSSKQELFDELKKAMPEFTASQAMYHAIKHNICNYQFFPNEATDEALEESEDMLLSGYDYDAVKKQTKLKHGLLLSNRYYSKRRFILQRGDYVIIDDPIDGKKVSEHRFVAAKELAHANKTTYNKAKYSIKSKVVVHKNQHVDENDYRDLMITDRKILYKINQINFVEKALELRHGTLLNLIEEDKLSRLRPEEILKGLFNEAGLTQQAQKLYSEPEKAEA